MRLTKFRPLIPIVCLMIAFSTAIWFTSNINHKCNEVGASLFYVK